MFFSVPSVLSISAKDFYSQESAPQGTRVPPTQTFLGVRHVFLSTNNCWKETGKNVDQSQHTSDLGSALWTLRNSAQDFRKDQKGLTFRTNRSVNSHTYSNCITLYTELKRRVYLANTFTYTVQIGSPTVSTWAPVDICEPRERYIDRSFQQTFVGQEPVTNP